MSFNIDSKPSPDFCNTKAVREFFAEDGYYLAKGVFSPEEIKLLENDFDRIVSQMQNSGENINGRWGGEAMKKIDGGESVIFHTHNVQVYSSRWLKALMQSNFLAATTAILGEDVILHHTKLFQKPSENGSPFPMHQDWTYFPSVKNSMIAAVVHVSDASDEMGCLRVYPGSHKLGRVEGTNGAVQSDLLDSYPIENSIPLEAKAGDVAFFHYFTLHGSYPNRSQQTRKTVLVQMHAGDDTIEERGLGHPYAKLVLNGWNSYATRKSANDI